MAAVAIALALLGASCAPFAPAASPHREPTLQEWTRARAALERMRASAPGTSWVADVQVSMQDPASGRGFDARGAVAVEPGRALRMILVGPGGGTAMDAWITRGRWRLAVPALERVWRGAAADSSSEAARALPVGFFRWWFLAPLEGKLLTATSDARGDAFVLATPDAVVELRARSRDAATELVAKRSAHARVEVLSWICAGLAPRAGDHGEYTSASGVRVSVRIEKIGDAPPPPESFVDPDAPGGER